MATVSTGTAATAPLDTGSRSGSPPGSSSGELMRTGEVAELLGLSRQTVASMCDRGDLHSMRVGSHRRVPRSEVDRYLLPTRSRNDQPEPGSVPVPGQVPASERPDSAPLTREQEKSLWLHRALLLRLLSDPDGALALASQNLDRWAVVHRADGMTNRYLEQWRQVLAAGLDEVIDVVTGTSPRACELRQNSPFAGLLPEDDRVTVLRSFKDHWACAHETSAVRR